MEPVEVPGHNELIIRRCIQMKTTIVDTGVTYHMHFQIRSLDQYFPCANIPAEKALREQGFLIQSHLDLLITRLHERISSPNNGVVNVVGSFVIITPSKRLIVSQMSSASG